MQDVLDKVIGFLLAAILLFGIPFLYFMERQEILEQSYLLTETAEFVDTVRIKGVLEKEVYEHFANKVGAASGIYEIKMICSKERLELADGKIMLFQEKEYQSQLISEMDREGRCRFQKGDFFKVEIVKKTPGAGIRLLKIFVKNLELEEQMFVYYGGSIRNDGD